jgi:hypothetical protein
MDSNEDPAPMQVITRLLRRRVVVQTAATGGGRSNDARRARLAAAIEPLDPVVAQLSDPETVARLAAALPRRDEWQADGGARWDGRDRDLNGAMYPIRIAGIEAAAHVGAAGLISCPSNAIWAWEVVDPTWRAALDTIDVAMAVRALRSENAPVTEGMARAHDRVLEIVTGR